MKLFYETFGEPSAPPLLLLMGAGSQGILWTDAFCNELAKKNFYIIHYDSRDTGLSTCVEYDKHPYSLKDLANDALHVLDDLHISKAHMVGVSMGGYLVQMIALHHPERLTTATLIMTTPNHMVFMNALAGKDTPTSDLPKPTREVLNFYATPPKDPLNRESAITHSLKAWKMLNGPKAPFDESYWKTLITKHYDRIKDHTAQYNHAKACLATPRDLTPELKKITTPTLIIHGGEDPLLPLAHGKALYSAIPHAKLLIIDDMGHSLNPTFQTEIINSIFRFIWESQDRKGQPQ